MIETVLTLTSTAMLGYGFARGALTETRNLQARVVDLSVLVFLSIALTALWRAEIPDWSYEQKPYEFGEVASDVWAFGKLHGLSFALTFAIGAFFRHATSHINR